jgi:glycosyltransferase involved in cell wall biosynthesis
MKLDVVMPTSNSLSRVGENIFRKVLEEIYAQIPVNRLLAVDDRSKDGTVDVLKEFNAVVVNGMGSLGKAREIGIHSVKTEWFYFIDDDNLIPVRFHEKMWKYVNDKVGMVFAQAIIPYENYLVRYETMMGRLRRSLGLQEVVESRGYTGATLLRKLAVEGIQIPSIGRQEDHYIKRYCEQQNWIVKYASDVIVWHFHRDLPSHRTQYLEGYGMAKVRSISGKRMLVSWLLTYPKSLLTLPYVRNINLLGEVPKAYYIKYRGYMDAHNKRV